MGTRQPVRKLWQQTGEREGREWRRGGRPQNLECLQAQGEETLSKKPKRESGQRGQVGFDCTPSIWGQVP